MRASEALFAQQGDGSWHESAWPNKERLALHRVLAAVACEKLKHFGLHLLTVFASKAMRVDAH